MKVNNINSQQNFGTKCHIGSISADVGLRKYEKNLLLGIDSAFKKLSKNGVDDELSLVIGPVSSKTIKNDVLNFSYFNSNAYKSSLNVNPKNLENNSVSDIKKFIMDLYKKLTKTDKKAEEVISFSHVENVKNPDTYSIYELCSRFGFDDSSVLH